MAKRFHPLMAITAIVKSTSSLSLNSLRANSNTLSGTCSWLTNVTASVHANAARSRSVKKGASLQTTTAYSLCSVSPCAQEQSRNNRGHHAVSWPVTGCYVAPAWLRPGASVRCLARAGWSAARRACETDLESFGDAVAVGEFADVAV